MATKKRNIMLTRANKLFQTRKIEEAIKELEIILESYPDDIEARRKMGDLQLKINNIPEAMDNFECIADQYLKNNDIGRAIAMYKRIARTDPSNEGVMFKLGYLYVRQGLVMEAIQIFNIMAKESQKRGNHKKTINIYKKLLEIDNNNIEVRKKLADVYLKAGMQGEAVEEYVEAADMLFNKKEYKKGEDLLVLASKKVKNYKLYEKSVHSYILQGEDDKAIDFLKNLGSELTDNLYLLKLLADIYLNKNSLKEAENILLDILKINSEEIQTVKKLGEIYIQRKEYDKAFQFFQPIVNKDMETGDFEEAESLLRFIIGSNNTYLPALTKLAKVYKTSGQKNNLIVLYESLLAIYEKNNNKAKCEGVLSELMNISDSPLVYKQRLEKLTGVGLTRTKKKNKKNFPSKSGEKNKEEGNRNLKDGSSGQERTINNFSLESLISEEESESVDVDIVALSINNKSPDLSSKKDKKSSKSLSDYLEELDFFINDRYYYEAEKLIVELKRKFPENKGLLIRIQQLQEAKQDETLPGIDPVIKENDGSVEGSAINKEFLKDIGPMEKKPDGDLVIERFTSVKGTKQADDNSRNSKEVSGENGKGLNIDIEKFLAPDAKRVPKYEIHEKPPPLKTPFSEDTPKVDPLKKQKESSDKDDSKTK